MALSRGTTFSNSRKAGMDRDWQTVRTWSQIFEKCQNFELSLPWRPSHHRPAPDSCWQGEPPPMKRQSGRRERRRASKPSKSKSKMLPIPEMSLIRCSRSATRVVSTSQESLETQRTGRQANRCQKHPKPSKKLSPSARGLRWERSPEIWDGGHKRSPRWTTREGPEAARAGGDRLRGLSGGGEATGSQACSQDR